MSGEKKIFVRKTFFGSCSLLKKKSTDSFDKIKIDLNTKEYLQPAQVGTRKRISPEKIVTSA